MGYRSNTNRIDVRRRRQRQRRRRLDWDWFSFITNYERNIDDCSIWRLTIIIFSKINQILTSGRFISSYFIIYLSLFNSFATGKRSTLNALCEKI